MDVLLANGCEVVTPRMQHCCGSLHGHNGELDTAREMARNIDAMERSAGSLDELDAGVRASGEAIEIAHPITLLARAYRGQK